MKTDAGPESKAGSAATGDASSLSRGDSCSACCRWLATAAVLLLVWCPYWVVPLFCEEQLHLRLFGLADAGHADGHSRDYKHGSHHRRLGGGGGSVLCPADGGSADRAWISSDLPFYLGVAHTLFGGWVMGRVADAARLPPVLGFIVAGFCSRPITDSITASAAPYIQTLAFLVVLVRAGLEIELTDLNRVTVPLGLLPVLADGSAIMATAMYSLGFSLTEAGALAFILASLGDGLVIPLMLELKPLRLGPMPRLMFTAAPLEACTALFTFGVFEGFAAAGANDQPAWSVILLGVVVKFVATLVVALGLAGAFVFLVEERPRFTVCGQPFFTGQPQEELLFVCAAALLAYGLADDEFIVMSNGYGGSLLHKDLAVVGVAVFYAALRPSSVHSLEHMFASIWTFGALFLFIHLGARIELGSFLRLPSVLPLLLAGLAARAVAYAAVLLATLPSRLQHDRHACHNLVYEWGFALVASLPRATIQGALAAIPANMGLFSHEKNEFMREAGVLCIAIMAPAGVVLQKVLAEPLLRRCRYDEDEANEDPQAYVPNVSRRVSQEYGRPKRFEKEWEHAARQEMPALEVSASTIHRIHRDGEAADPIRRRPVIHRQHVFAQTAPVLDEGGSPSGRGDVPALRGELLRTVSEGAYSEGHDDFGDMFLIDRRNRPAMRQPLKTVSGPPAL